MQQRLLDGKHPAPISSHQHRVSVECTLDDMPRLGSEPQTQGASAADDVVAHSLGSHRRLEFDDDTDTDSGDYWKFRRVFRSAAVRRRRTIPRPSSAQQNARRCESVKASAVGRTDQAEGRAENTRRNNNVSAKGK